MKNFYLLFVALIMSFGLYAETTAVEPTQGDGSKENPYQIENLANLRWLSENDVWNQHFIQTADIDATETENWNSGEGFSPIGRNSYFRGSYNGDYKKISNLTINRPNTFYQGLFGQTNNGATIEKLQLENVDFKGDNYLGGIAGASYNTTISRVSVTGSIVGDYYIGGICGNIDNTSIKESFSDANIIATSNTAYVGGIVGSSLNGKIINNYSFSTISANGSARAGGIIGYNYNSTSTVENNYFAGTFDGDSYYRGGIISEGSTPNTQSGNFWDSDKTGTINNYANCGEAKTTTEMQDVNTFIDAGWSLKLKNSINYNVWNIGIGKNSGYPYFNWQYPNDPPALDIPMDADIKIKSIKATSSTEATVVLAVNYVGNPIATEYGFCYSLNDEPTVSDNKVESSAQIDEADFNLSISSLEAEKLYYFRPYYSDNGTVSYGEVFHFAIVEEQEPTGEGSSEEPYLISNFNELLWVSNHNDIWDKHFKQTDDIDATLSKALNNGEGFSPIGNSITNFRGSYNGAYKKISNLTINRPNTDNIGLFGYTNSATIEKLQLEDVDIKGYNSVGGVVGNSYDYNTISEITVTGSIYGYNTVGGVVGNNYNYNTISQATVSGSINGNNSVGGITGYNYFSTISQTSVSGSINGNLYVAGICGDNRHSTIKESFSDATIIGNSDVSGIIGVDYWGVEISNNYSLSTISAQGSSYAGGIIGNCYQTANILKNNYFAGTFDGESPNRGGIIGYGGASTDIGNFWDSDKSGVTTTKGNGVAKTTTEMQNMLTFIDAGWSFKLKNSIDYQWNINSNINDGYPFLDWQYPLEDEIDITLAPIFSLKEVNMSSSTDADVKITVNYLGNPTLTEIGVCYGFNESPEKDVDNTEKKTENIEEGELTISTSNLELNKLYYFRAYTVYNGDTYYDDNTSITFVVDLKPTGEGTQEEPYLISNFNELLWVSNHKESWDKHFKQTDDIDATLSKALNNGEGFSPIGSNNSRFTGSYNGDYKTISNLTINRPNADYIGLFGYTDGATIEKLQLKDIEIEGYTYVGGLVGFSSYYNTISEITVTGSIVGYNRVGGVAGYISNSNITQTTVAGSITGNESVGGVVGGNWYSSIISQTAVTGSIVGSNSVGGISGYSESSTIKESFSNATIIGNDFIGGVLGNSNGNSEVINSYSLSTISANGSSRSGGVIGYCYNASTFKNNYFAGTFDGESSNRGGIIGNAYNAPNTDSGNFWDSEKSGVTTTKGNGTAKTTAEMKDILTFAAADWEFAGLGLHNEIWDIDENLNNGYPYLVWAQQYIEDTSTNIKQKTKTGEVVAIYPNPFNDIVTITGNGINSVKIYTTSGVQLLDVKYNNVSDVTIPTSDFDKGIYLFVVEDGGNVETYKLVKR